MDDELTHLYTLIIKPDQTYEVKIDNAKVESGNLEDDWDLLPAKKIKDPEVSKPEDWDDRETIDDVDDKKPEREEEIDAFFLNSEYLYPTLLLLALIDFQHDAAQPQGCCQAELSYLKKILSLYLQCPLLTATKKRHYTDWDKPENIPDPDAKKPEDWDEEMDGEWEPPMIPNPDYKGEWKPKQIKNPNYKGAWVHPEIDNPEYAPDTNMYRFENIGVIGLDLWQVKSGTIFDNFLITNDERYAEEFGKETWGKTK
eukprot:g43750.t1